MNLSDRIDAFVSVGKFLAFFSENKHNTAKYTFFEEDLYKEFSELISYYHNFNGWFDEKNIKEAILGILKWLNRDTLINFTQEYSFNENTSKSVGLILAGNIPFVGFHDFLCVLLSGNKAIIKQSSNDMFLMPFIAKLLIKHNPLFSNLIDFTDRLNNIDAVIATGSNNSSRYFKSYFGHLPHIFRNNRKSIAILTGKETKDELVGLSNDIAKFYGLGCRSISLLFVPINYDLNNIFGTIFKQYSHIQNHKKYANNLDYNRAVYSLNKIKFLENGLLIVLNRKELFAPVSVLNYSEYSSLDEVTDFIKNNNESIQCVSGNIKDICTEALGNAQMPEINSFSDNINTLKFLEKI